MGSLAAHECDDHGVPVVVVPYSDDWPAQFEGVARDLHAALEGVPVESIEHVGSTAVPGLAAKPILDIDIIVQKDYIAAAIHALALVGYVHRGDLGVAGREALAAPVDEPARHVYVCMKDTLHVRNHLAVREALRRRPDLREMYSVVKLALSNDPDMDMERYLAGKSAVLQNVLALSDLSDEEKVTIYRLNAGRGPR